MNSALSKYYLYKALSKQIDNFHLKNSLISAADELLNNEYLALQKQVSITSKFVKNVNDRTL